MTVFDGSGGMLRTLAVGMVCSLCLSSLGLAQSAGPVVAPVASVAAVDLARYVGKWFEIASFPMFFQRQCVGDTTASYALGADGRVEVTNRCRTESGFDEANGIATVVEGWRNSRLKVSFFWPFKSDYWVLGLDDDYRWAVVGNPNRKYLWVLSRTPQLPKPLLDAALTSATAQGFDLSQLRYTTQANQ
jgi:apolipoprotein D and lipocalin family protein